MVLVAVGRTSRVSCWQPRSDYGSCSPDRHRNDSHRTSGDAPLDLSSASTSASNTLSFSSCSLRLGAVAHAQVGRAVRKERAAANRRPTNMLTAVHSYSMHAVKQCPHAGAGSDQRLRDGGRTATPKHLQNGHTPTVRLQMQMLCRGLWKACKQATVGL